MRFCIRHNINRQNALLRCVAIGLWASWVAISTPCFAEETFSIYGVFRPFTMDDQSPIVRDYYIDAGREHGLRSGQKIVAYRRLTTSHGETGQMQHDFLVKIAVLKIVHTDSTASVARLEKMISTAETAQVSPSTLIIGDLIGIE